ncbi:MAG: sulfite exporter TauE/SafE family protein [Candidatus Undinarchaeales archaeon]|jgi:ABC-type nickel/cobalt efflux system permease component RcnA|nr:sulfite exporter TauE/SafE family protein [Candidatus Undinarchaeales archaeon]MDP7491870.1 sulfite exporter TauE/SafE family protein [Candidatus Undinarchaeales archaeon]
MRRLVLVLLLIAALAVGHPPIRLLSSEGGGAVASYHGRDVTVQSNSTLGRFRPVGPFMDFHAVNANGSLVRHEVRLLRVIAWADEDGDGSADPGETVLADLHPATAQWDVPFFSYIPSGGRIAGIRFPLVMFTNNTKVDPLLLASLRVEASMVDADHTETLMPPADPPIKLAYNGMRDVGFDIVVDPWEGPDATLLLTVDVLGGSSSPDGFTLERKDGAARLFHGDFILHIAPAQANATPATAVRVPVRISEDLSRPSRAVLNLTMPLNHGASIRIPLIAHGTGTEQREEERSFIWFALLLGGAFLTGALHGLEPGHGKTLVVTYLVGTGARLVDAVVLGLTATVTHTAGVLALAVLALSASEYFLPEVISYALSVLSGTLVTIVGLWMFRRAWRGKTHDHHHVHKHGERVHDNDHEHLSPGEGTRRNFRELVSLGMAGGIVPCPAALVLLIVAVSRGRFAEGIAVLLAFSLGVSTTLVGIGVAAVAFTSVMQRVLGSSTPVWAQRISLASATVITCMGLMILHLA